MLRYLVLSLVLMSNVHAKKPRTGTLRLLSTNFENLFDHTHDRGKVDYTYLPLAVKRESPEAMAYCESQTGFYREECLTLDWTSEVVDRKVARIAGVLKRSMGDVMPDVIVAAEVENRRVLARVARALGRGYRAVLMEGPDERGVDVGLITRLPVLRVRLHNFETSSGRPTRGILEVDVLLNRQRVTVLANHWPSQSNPDEDRMRAGSLLLKVAHRAQRRSRLVLAAGDFNTAEDDQLNALKDLVLPAFWDAESEAVARGVDLGARATYSYRGVWASLDHIFIMKNAARRGADFSRVSIFTDGGRLVEEYVFQGQTESRPVRYDYVTGAGYSDHLPLGMVIKL